MSKRSRKLYHLSKIFTSLFCVGIFQGFRELLLVTEVSCLIHQQPPTVLGAVLSLLVRSLIPLINCCWWLGRVLKLNNLVDSCLLRCLIETVLWRNAGQVGWKVDVLCRCWSETDAQSGFISHHYLMFQPSLRAIVSVFIDT